MIDWALFKKSMGEISERCAKPPSTHQLTMYYRFLSPRLTDDEFMEAAQHVWSDATFFPPPMAFLKARTGREWDKVSALISEYTPPIVKEGWLEAWEALSEESRLAIKRLGGVLAFRDKAYNRDPVRAYETFIKAYTIALQDTATRLLEDGDETLMIGGGA